MQQRQDEHLEVCGLLTRQTCGHCGKPYPMAAMNDQPADGKFRSGRALTLTGPNARPTLRRSSAFAMWQAAANINFRAPSTALLPAPTVMSAD
jgi:hypothetical protein